MLKTQPHPRPLPECNHTTLSLASCERAKPSSEFCRMPGQKLCLGRFFSSNLRFLVPWKFEGSFLGRFLVDRLVVFWSFLIVFWSFFGRCFGRLFFCHLFVDPRAELQELRRGSLVGPLVRSCHFAGSFPCLRFTAQPVSLLPAVLLSISGGLLPPFSVSLLSFSGVLLCLTVAWKRRVHQHTALQMF